MKMSARKKTIYGFQSSLELSPECNSRYRFFTSRARVSFNPHSSFRPSATYNLSAFEELIGVSILTRAFARVQRDSDNAVPLTVWQVSILTRAFARVQRCRQIRNRQMRQFQSSLELSPECNSPILACVLDRAQGGFCANLPKRGSDAGWRRVGGKRVFNVP